MSEELDDYYDLCINGTGLVESIVACAASKCGLKVLHLDSNEYYGSQDRSYTLQEFLDLIKFESNQLDTHGNLNTIIRSSYRANITPTIVEDDDYEDIMCPDLLSKARYFNIDSNCKLLLCSGSSVDSIIKSGVSNYLEFKSIDNIHFLSNSSEILIVPCSKSDVFNSKLLNAIDKRILTKFLQFVDDYGRELHGVSVHSLNEKNLAQGRSLYRPQNKDYSNTGYNVDKYIDKPFIEFMTHCKISSHLQQIIIHALCLYMRHISTNTTSTTTTTTTTPLTTSSSSSSSTLSNISIQDTFVTSTALKQLSSFLNSLGRYGDTALLCPLYGMSEVIQSFCRMAAVWGAVYVLRRGVQTIQQYDETIIAQQQLIQQQQQKAISYNDSNSTDNLTLLDHDNDLKDIKKDDVITSNNSIEPSTTPTTTTTTTTMPSSSSKSGLQPHFIITDSTGHHISCHAYLTSIAHYPCTDTVVGSVLTRISILSRRLLPKDRNILVIPPYTKTINNTHAIYIIQVDSSTMMSAESYYLLYIITQIDCVETVIYTSNLYISYNVIETNSSHISWPDYVKQNQDDINIYLSCIMNTIVSLVYISSSSSSSSSSDTPDCILNTTSASTASTTDNNNDSDSEDVKTDNSFKSEIYYVNTMRPLFQSKPINILPPNTTSTTLIPDSLSTSSSTAADADTCIDTIVTIAAITDNSAIDRNMNHNILPTSSDDNNNNNNNSNNNTQEITDASSNISSHIYITKETRDSVDITYVQSMEIAQSIFHQFFPTYEFMYTPPEEHMNEEDDNNDGTIENSKVAYDNSHIENDINIIDICNNETIGETISPSTSTTTSIVPEYSANSSSSSSSSVQNTSATVDMITKPPICYNPPPISSMMMMDIYDDEYYELKALQSSFASILSSSSSSFIYTATTTTTTTNTNNVTTATTSTSNNNDTSTIDPISTIVSTTNANGIESETTTNIT